MNSPSAPASPDFNALAQQQGKLNQQAAYQATTANRFDQSNPYGSMTWSQQQVMGPDGKPVTKWSSNVNLSPEQQFLFDKGEASKRALAERSPQYAQMVADYLSNPMETGAGVRDRVESELLGRLNQQSDRDLEQVRSRLLNQGITENSEAWRRQMADFDMNRQNARTSALLSAGDAAQQQVAMSTGLRSQYLNEMGNILGQTQATIPNYQYGAAVSAPAPDMYGAAQDQYAAALQNYNSKIAQNGQLIGAGGQLAGAGMMALAMSDERLKSNIVRVGEDLRGFGIYEYDIADRRERGVLAQEVESIVPEAVTEIDGIKHVAYGVLGIEREVLNG